MRFEPKDPDIATVVRRIEQRIYDLQPDFQRGEVWSTVKKQRLIDSILRQWHVPPIHLVATDDGVFDVLDGQQRLTAIRDFVNGKFPIDGMIEPVEDEIVKLSGLRYGELPTKVRNKFDNFSIRVFELDEYKPQEPYELFFRLNQPTVLTEAEKRNAFIGGPRNQVKEIVDWAVDEGMNPSRLGFSNARMSYDDLIARFLITLDQRTLVEKVTATRITNRYRADTPFSDEVVSMAKAALEALLQLPFLDDPDDRLKPNKATIHTWLCMGAKLYKHGLIDQLRDPLNWTIRHFESSRLRKSSTFSNRENWPLTIFHDRSTSRVADTSSVMLRDLTAWMYLVRKFRIRDSLDLRFLKMAVNAWNVDALHGVGLDRALSEWGTEVEWGGRGWF